MAQIDQGVYREGPVPYKETDPSTTCIKSELGICSSSILVLDGHHDAHKQRRRCGADTTRLCSYRYREGRPNSQPRPHRQHSLAHPQEHASHSVEGSSTCEWNILLELTRQTRGAGGDRGWIVPNSTARPTQQRRTGRAQARMCVKHHERSQTTEIKLPAAPAFDEREMSSET